MFIAVLSLNFQLHGCSSLKEKRQRLGGLREKFGRLPQITVCETWHPDQWQSSEWSFVVVSTDKRQVTQRLSQIQLYSQQSLDAVVSRSQIEWLWHKELQPDKRILLREPCNFYIRSQY